MLETFVREHQPFEAAARRVGAQLERNGIFLQSSRGEDFFAKSTAARKRIQAAAAERHLEPAAAWTSPKRLP